MKTEEFEERQQAGVIDGWYILEIFGHQRYAGYVTVQNLGIAAMVRIDVPPLEDRERTLKRPGYVGVQYLPVGSVVKESAVQGYTKLFGVGAIYAMTPCTKEACLAAVEELQPRKMSLVSMPASQMALTGPADPDDESESEDDKEGGF